MQILSFTTLYPNALQPQHGIFVEARLRQLVASGAIGARVVAPCPWFPFTSAQFGEYAVYARIAAGELRHGLWIDHPRYPVLPKIGMSAAPLGLFGALLPVLLRQISKGRDFDLIDAHYFYPDGVAAVLLGRALGRPVVVTARGSDLNVIARHWAPRHWIRWAARHADGLVAVSHGLKDRLIELGVAGGRVRVLRNGVDLSLFQPHDRKAARRNLGLTRLTLLAVGNLVALKRHQLMIDAVARLPEAELVIVGDGPERAAIERAARERGIVDRVRLLGRMPQDRLPEIYSAADLLVLVSSHEGWPNVLLESLACGTPVVVSDIGVAADIVGAPEAGRIVPDPTPTRLAAAIRELVAAAPSRAATRHYAEQFDWQSTTDGQIALFREIVERRAGRSPLPSRPPQMEEPPDGRPPGRALRR